MGISIGGLVSGIDSQSIIEVLNSITLAPTIRLRERIDEHNLANNELSVLSTILLNLKLNVFDLTKSTAFNTTDVSSTNDSVISASGSTSTVTGSYNIQALRLAQASHFLSAGHPDQTTTTLPAGTITVEQGGGGVDHKSLVDDLNAGQGISRGIIRITDGLSRVADIDLSGVVDVDDILDTINSNNSIQVTASIRNDGLVLTDASGGGSVSVVDVGGGDTVRDLGLDKTHSGGVIVGDDINTIDANTPLSFLNDGNGLETLDIGTIEPDDIIFTLTNGASFGVNMSNLNNVQDAISAINNDTDNAGRVIASFNADGKGLRLVDTVGGAGDLSVTAGTHGPFSLTSGAVNGLGLDGITAQNATGGTAAGPRNTLVGKRLIGTLNSVLKDTINGSSRFTDGSITITDRQGGGPTTINLSRRVETTTTMIEAVGSTIIEVTSTDGFYIGGRVRFDNGSNVEYHTVTDIAAGTSITIDEGIEAAAGYGAGAAVYAENQSLQDVIGAISNNTAINVTAQFNDEKNGLKIVDDNTLAPTSDLSIVEVASTTAADLGILTGVAGPQAVTTGGSSTSLIATGLSGASDFYNGMELMVTSGANAGQKQTIIDFDAATGTVTFDSAFTAAFGVGDTFTITGVDQDEFNGFDINRQYISRQTKLSELNQGDGVFLGSFRVTDGSTNFNVDASNLDSETATLGDLMDIFSLAATGPSTSIGINSDGNGLLITSGGGNVVSIADTNGGTTAADLNIAVTNSTATTIDGSFQKTITLVGTETLADLRDSIQSLGLDVSASIINDGSATNPFRLNIVSNGTGENHRLIIDNFDDFNNFAYTEASQAQDAAASLGSSSSVVISSSNNTFENILPGVTVTLNSIGSATINVSKNIDSIVEKVQELVDGFNEGIEKIDEVTAFNIVDADLDGDGVVDPDGALAGNSSVNLARSRLFGVITSLLNGVAAPFNKLSSIGISIRADGTGLDFDDDELRSALDSNFDEIERLFRLGPIIEESTLLSSLRGKLGVRNLQGTNDFIINFSDGTNFEVNIDSANTIQEVINLINFHPNNGGKAVAALRLDGEGLQVTDNTGGTGTFSITNLNTSRAASDLGIQTQAVNGNVLKGFSIRTGKFNELDGRLGLIVNDDGVFDGEQNKFDSLIQDLEDQIERIESRAAAERARLELQFAALEGTTAELQSQQQFLSAQLANLPSFSNN